MRKIFLASSSPRRLELLKQIGINFEVIPSCIDESIFLNLTGENLVKTLSYEKAKDIFNKNKNTNNDFCVIGCDTIVSINDKILLKPKNKKDALNMLILLNNNVHNVLTGLTVIGYDNGNFFEKTICSTSKVYFSNFTHKELKNYVDTLEPMDKAGAYGIQGKGSFLVSKIEGDFYSIMGLPINILYSILKTHNFLS